MLCKNVKKINKNKTVYFWFICVFPDIRLSMVPKRKEDYFMERSMAGLFWAVGFLGFLFQPGLQGEQKGGGVLNPLALAYCSD